jgi:hypothetical protein
MGRCPCASGCAAKTSRMRHPRVALCWRCARAAGRCLRSRWRLRSSRTRRTTPSRAPRRAAWACMCHAALWRVRRLAGMPLQRAFIRATEQTDERAVSTQRLEGVSPSATPRRAARASSRASRCHSRRRRHRLRRHRRCRPRCRSWTKTRMTPASAISFRPTWRCLRASRRCATQAACLSSSTWCVRLLH